MAGVLQFSLGLDVAGFVANIGRGLGAVKQFAADTRREFAVLAKPVTIPVRMGAAGIGGLVSGMHQLNGAVELLGRVGGVARMLAENLLAPAAAMEQNRVAFEVLTGSAEKAGSTLGKIAKMAASTPYELPELVQAGQKLIAFGEGADGVTGALRRIGDVASGVGAPIGEIAEIFGKARVQNQLFAEDINQLTGRGIPVLQELAKVMGVNADQVKKLASEGKITFPLLDQAFRNMTGSGGQFAGMMEKQSATAVGLWSTLKDAFGELQRLFGGPVVDALKPFLTDAIGMVEGLQGAVKKAGEAVADWLGMVRGGFMGGFGWEAMLAPLNLGFLEVANSFSMALQQGVASAAAWLDEIRIRFLSFTWSKKSEDEAVARSQADWDHVKNVLSGGPGPFQGEIDAEKKRIKEMRKAAAANVDAADGRAAIEKSGRDLEAWLGDWVGNFFGKADVADGLTDALRKVRDDGGVKSAAKSAGETVGKRMGDGMGDGVRDALKRKFSEEIAPTLEKWGEWFDISDKWSGRRSGADMANERREENQRGREMRRAQRRQESREKNAARKAERGINPLDWLEAGRRPEATADVDARGIARRWRERNRDWMPGGPMPIPAGPYDGKREPAKPDTKAVDAATNWLEKIYGALEKLEVWS